MQGSPISPLLSNVYLHPFDVELTGRGYRLVRYCDDFLITARSRPEAEAALNAAARALASRRLKLSRDKTRIVAPGEPFEFLGYQFTAEGRVLPPPSLPAVVAERMIAFANRHAARGSAKLKSTTRKTTDFVSRIKDRLRKR